jgi:hypothetical protein
MPFWLQPKKLYVGAAWYQKTVKIPKGWSGKRIVLYLERVHWESRVWVDEVEVSSNDRLSVPHEHDLSRYLTAGKHRITVRVDNRMLVNVGVNSHSVSDHTQGNWNGIVGKIELRAMEPVWVEDVQVYPDVDHNMATVKLKLGNITGKPVSMKVSLNAECPMGKPLEPVDIDSRCEGKETELTASLNLGRKMLLWDEFGANLYSLTVKLANGSNKTIKFGLRKLETKGTQFVVNDRITFFRGTLECAIFPLTGYPPMDKAYWNKIIKTCQAHGLNHIRFHSWCPPEVAYEVADELGFYYQVECASWASGKKADLGKGGDLDKWLYDEGHAIVKAYGNHPSFMLMAYGNEPGGKLVEFLSKWCEYWEKEDPRRLHTSGSGWPMLKECDFYSTAKPRIQGWGQGLGSIINAEPPRSDYDWGDFIKNHADKPTISHEIGQWCVYPNFDEIKKYTGMMQAKNFEVFREFLKEHHMLDQAHDFLMASGRLQVLCYKADIEAALRTEGFGGFQLLDLHDFPGQGTALVGVLDPFWDSKPYVDAAEYSQFCNAIVPLALFKKRVFLNSEDLVFQLKIAHYGSFALKNAVVWWKLKDKYGHIKVQGVSDAADIAAGGLFDAGKHRVALDSVSTAQQLQLEAGITGTEFVNRWNVWVYPDEERTAPQDILITHKLDEFAMGRLKAGAKVLLLMPPKRVKTSVKLGFSTIFWNTAWTGGQPPHTMGILCDPAHDLFTMFPTEYHSDWQWWDLIKHGATMEMDELPVKLRPLVQIVPDWFDPKRLGLLFEAKVNGGKLMVCSIDLQKKIHERPVARQFNKSLMAYMASDKFNPTIEVEPRLIRALMKEDPKPLDVVVKADSAQSGYEAAKAVDGNEETMWHTPWAGQTPGYPHWLIVDLKSAKDLAGIWILPRQDNNRNGRFKHLVVRVSADGKSWSDPVADVGLARRANKQVVRFGGVQTARYLKLEVSQPLRKNCRFAALAELGFIPAK